MIMIMAIIMIMIIIIIISMVMIIIISNFVFDTKDFFLWIEKEVFFFLSDYWSPSFGKW